MVRLLLTISFKGSNQNQNFPQKVPEFETSLFHPPTSQRHRPERQSRLAGQSLKRARAQHETKKCGGRLAKKIFI